MIAQKEQPEIQVFKTVLLHCVVILAFPIIAFFISKIFLFDGLFGLSTVSSNVYSAGVAIIVLHLALAAFIYKAYFDSPTKAPTKAD